VNFAKGASLHGDAHRRPYGAVSLVVFLLSWGMGGCSDNVRTPTPEQLAAFEKSEPIKPAVDLQRVEEARLQVGPYRVVPGDVLEFTMPALLQAVSAAEVAAAKTRNEEERPYLCRVNEQGTIQLPAAGTVAVAGLSLSEIEVKVADTYRQLVALRPSVFVRVLEYKTLNVYITGAVEKPGVYSLRGDQMSLAHLLNEAGGILMRDAGGALMREAGGVSGPGAALIRITSLEQQARSGAQSKVEPDLTIRDGGAGEIVIAFTPADRQTTAGRLVLSRGRRVLLDERLDLRQDLPRRALLGKLSELDSGFSILDLEARLVAVADRAGASWGGPADLARLDPNASGHTLALSPRRSEGDPQRGTARGGTQAVVLPVYGLNIPYTNVALHEGDTVVVERLRVPMFSVVGLVRSPGNFPYPPDTEFNLMQAVAFAGGLDPVADPRYATVYRLTADGSIVRVPFQLVKDGELTAALQTPIKPGDVVAIEHTPRTRRNTIFNNMVRFNTGLYLTGSDLWGN
jgi:protein involved in polysaccharide export with SLBB domain